MDDIVINKSSIIERCLARIREEFEPNPGELESNLTVQDSILLNLQRACEASTDLAMHLVKVHKLGAPKDSRDAFALLQQKGLLSGEMSEELQKMVGFRNIAVHNYRKLDLSIVRSIITDKVNNFSDFTCSLLQGRE